MYVHELCALFLCFFFFNDTATTEIYTLSLHDALPICGDGARVPGERRRPARSLRAAPHGPRGGTGGRRRQARQAIGRAARGRSEEHTSELQSPCNLVCRLLLEKKKKKAQLQSNEQYSH